MKNKIMIIGGDIILAMIYLGFMFSLTGCFMWDHPPARKGIIVVEKSPIRVTYINDSVRISDKTLALAIEETHKVAYRHYKFNEKAFDARGNLSGHQTDHESDTDSMTRKVDINSKRKSR